MQFIAPFHSQGAGPRIEALEAQTARISELSKSIVEHFCEDERSFNIEECIRLFATFCAKVREAVRVGTDHARSFGGFDSGKCLFSSVSSSAVTNFS